MTDLKSLDVCRLCLDSADRLGELTNQLIYIISSCFSIKICISSVLTNKVCQACVDQLENVYKYRKKILKNEIILLEKSRAIIVNYSAKVDLNSIQVNSDIGGVKDKAVRLNVNDLEILDNESDIDELNTAAHEKFRTEIDKREKYTILESEEDKLEEKNGSSSSNIDSIWQHLNSDNKDIKNLNTVETDPREDDFNALVKDQHDMKLNTPHITIRQDIEDLIARKDSLKANEKYVPSIHPIACELSNQINTILETDKENTDVTNFTTNDLNINEESLFNDQDKPDLIRNQNQSYVIDMNRKFMCLTCLKVFGSQKELSIHYKTVELSKAVKESSRKYKDYNIVKVSMNGGENVFKCGVCSKVFDNKTSGIKHTQIHKVERPFLCNLCSRTYKTVADILRHGVVHNGFQIVCSFECGYTTVHSGALREHEKRHKKEFKYKCEKCSKCFQVKTWYEQHQNVHDKVRPFECKLCGQAFSMARYLTAHRANVHPQSSKVKRYKCVHCALPCDSRRSLVLHMKQKHGMKTDCLCDVCGQILPDQQKLMLHKSIHEGLRKFSCRFCKKTFNKKDHKTVHEKIHTGERLNCSSCTKSFTQRCSLRRHIKRYHQLDQQSLDLKT